MKLDTSFKTGKTFLHVMVLLVMIECMAATKGLHMRKARLGVWQATTFVFLQ